LVLFFFCKIFLNISSAKFQIFNEIQDLKRTFHYKYNKLKPLSFAQMLYRNEVFYSVYFISVCLIYNDCPGSEQLHYSIRMKLFEPGRTDTLYCIPLQRIILFDSRMYSFQRLCSVDENGSLETRSNYGSQR
jgi:hypothetical protein